MSLASKPIYTVRVRELAEFVLRRGDLGGERDFVSSTRALAGTRGHQKLQRSRPVGYQKEKRLSFDLETDQFLLRIQGRLDGVLTTAEETLLEEIKTTEGTWDGVADPLHWAQVRLYGFMYAHEHALNQIALQLTYLALETGEVTQFKELASFAQLKSFFESTTAVYLSWIRERHEWCQRRNDSISSLSFPFAAFRAGQRRLAVAVYRALVQGRQLFLEAPTGIGKTISVLFPAVKVLAEGKLERLFYLTARTVGRAIAEKAFADMRGAGLRIRTLTLTAKQKLCVREGHPCDPATCPLALGYYDRNKAAMRAALDREEITRSVLEDVSRQHQVCPFELSLDVSSWVDAVICDYNYVFDPQVYLRRHFGEDGGHYAFLVDEAHNLVDRAREMFSAELDAAELEETSRATRSVPGCAKALRRLVSALRKLAGSSVESAEPSQRRSGPEELGLFPAQEVSLTSPRSFYEEQGGAIRISQELPQQVLPLLEQALEEMEAWLAQSQAAEFRETLLELYFRLRAFQRTAEVYDERFVTIVSASTRVRLFCLDPSDLLSQALARGSAAVFFSATLRPLEYYRSLLGGTAESMTLQLDSPFPRQNLAVLVHGGIRTHFKARSASLVEVAEAIGALVQQRQGNYLVYFPSFKYLAAVREHFEARYPTFSMMVQSPGMSESERDAFVAAFRAEQRSTLVGFAVMGGIFGEGIDLVGDHLIGAVIVGVGLPQLSIERDLIRNYFQERTGEGFDYAYTFPGMNRVLQAVGRVIRHETDRGMVLLIDARFKHAKYVGLFPAWWQPEVIGSTAEIARAALRFWQTPAQPEPLDSRTPPGTS